MWKESSNDLHLTFIASSIDVGYRRPVVPSEKDGVVIQLGSSSNFSAELVDLNRETSPLRTFKPRCPRNFKRTSVERHFREKGFALDWCAFRLLELTSGELSLNNSNRINLNIKSYKQILIPGLCFMSFIN